MELLYQVLRNVTQPARVCRGSSGVPPFSLSLLITTETLNNPQHWRGEALAGVHTLKVGWAADVISLNKYLLHGKRRVAFPWLLTRPFLVFPYSSSPCLAFCLCRVYLSSYISQIKAVITRVRI